MITPLWSDKNERHNCQQQQLLKSVKYDPARGTTRGRRHGPRRRDNEAAGRLRRRPKNGAIDLSDEDRVGVHCKGGPDWVTIHAQTVDKSVLHILVGFDDGLR